MFRRCTIPSNTSLTRKRGERGWTCRCGVGFGLVWQRLVRWQGNGPSPRLRVRLVFSRPYVAVFKLSAIGLARQGTCHNSNSQISYLLFGGIPSSSPPMANNYCQINSDKSLTPKIVLL